MALAYFTNYALARAEGSTIWKDQPPYVEEGATRVCTRIIY